MKTRIIILAAFAAALAVCACTKEIPQENEKTVDSSVDLVPMTFTATIDNTDDSDPTKTTLSGLDVMWKAGDRIAIFDNTDATVAHLFTATSSGATTSFEGTASATATKFFAVYPYEAAVSCDPADWVNGTTDCSGKLVVNIPEFQEATAGSFDPAANISAAYTTSSDNNLRFRIVASLVSFKVSRDDVLAVTLSGSKNMSGSLQVNVTTAGGVGTGDGSGTKLKDVVVKKSDGTPLTSGSTYYAVIRYRTDSNAYGDFAAKIITSAEEVGTKTTTNALSISRGAIRSLGVLNPAVETNRYEYYNAGYDLTLGGKTYNRATDGDATLLANGAVFKTGQEGVILVEASASITNTSEVTVTGDVVLASNDPSRPATYTGTSGKSLLLKSGNLTIDNMKVNMSAMTSGQFMTKKDNDGNMSSLTLWQCDFSGISRYVFSPNSSYLNNGIEEIIINGCRFATTTNVQLFSINSNVETLAGYDKFTFTNNVVYSTTGDAQTGTYVFATSSTKVSESTCHQQVIMDNNLFYNIAASSGIFRTYYLQSVNIRNNVLWAKDGSYSSNIKLFGLNLATASSTESVKATFDFTGESSNNYCFGDLGTKSWSISDTKYRGPLTNVTTLDSNPIKSFDITSGVFELVDAYKAYGPQIQPM